MTEPTTQGRSSQRAGLLFAGLALALAAAGYAYYRQDQASILTQRHQDLQAITRLKVGQIQAWRRERLD
ncbi:MAG: hypothetical protein WDA75_11355, partial [Candidatus Latescibacterota bacterium]